MLPLLITVARSLVAGIFTAKMMPAFFLCRKKRWLFFPRIISTPRYGLLCGLRSRGKCLDVTTGWGAGFRGGRGLAGICTRTRRKRHSLSVNRAQARMDPGALLRVIEQAALCCLETWPVPQTEPTPWGPSAERPDIYVEQPKSPSAMVPGRTRLCGHRSPRSTRRATRQGKI